MTANPGEPTPEKKMPPKKNENLKQKAQKAINKSVAPVPLSNAFSGFHPDIRGNVLIELDLNIADRFTYHVIPLVRNYMKIMFLFPGETDPTLTYLRTLACSLNAAIALKLLYAIPQQELSTIFDLNALNQFHVRVPVGFIPILALLGKTDHYDSVLRVKHSPYLIRLHFLKMIWLAIKTYSFSTNQGMMVTDKEEVAQLLNLTQLELEDIIFDDYIAVEVFKRKGRKALDNALKEVYTVEVDDDEYSISPAYISDRASKTQYIQWMNRLHPDLPQEQLATLGLVTIFDKSWLTRLNDPLSVIDPTFANTVVANITPSLLLETLGVNFIGRYFPSQGSFLNMCLQVLSWLNAESHVLENIGQFADTPKTSFGHASQLVTLDMQEVTTLKTPFADQSTKPNSTVPDGFLHIAIPKHTATLVYAAKKLTTPGEILTAAAFMITKEVTLNERFRGFTTQTLFSTADSIARAAFGKRV